MRQRKIKNLQEKIDVFSDYIICEPKEHRGELNRFFPADQPLYLEIGCGKGQFITRCARRYPESNFIAVEGHQSVALRALEKAAEDEAENIRFILNYIDDLGDYFEPGELSGIFLNFSDPWPKDRHAKRRLTSEAFMAVYDQILSPDGTVEFKTDNRGLFDYSLESIPAAGWKIVEHTFDLHNSPMAEGNVMTEYEMKFSSEGKPICKLVARR